MFNKTMYVNIKKITIKIQFIFQNSIAIIQNSFFYFLNFYIENFNLCTIGCNNFYINCDGIGWW